MPSVDLTHVNLDAFARDVDALHADLMADLGPRDIAHLKRMRRWSHACSLLGYGTAWIAPNPLSMFLISIGSVSAWITMHHVSHRGYDKVPGMPKQLTSRVYAQGWRRYIDWFDWMLPEAWAHEHNHLHHPHTGQEADPDLVERNAFFLREARIPKPFKWVALLLGMMTWRFAYYVPNTIRELHRARRRRAGNPDGASPEETFRQLYDVKNPEGRAQWQALLDPRTPEGADLWTKCLLPYALIRFVLIPAAFLPLGAAAAAYVLINSVVAEALMNMHSFAVIVPNHTGDDIPRFEGPARHGKGEFYLRQVVGSANFHGGTDITDFLQGYLNYQIEHHVWPDLPMLKYREAQPRLEAICRAHRVPYVKHNVFWRMWKTAEVIVGRSTTPYAVIAPLRTPLQ